MNPHRHGALTITVKVRLPASVRWPGADPGTGAAPPADAGRELLRTLLPIVEPAALLLAEAAGAGLLGQIVFATALRGARQALAA